MGDRLWAIVREPEAHGLPGEILTVSTDRDELAELVRDLGERHHLVPAPQLAGARVAHLWMCRAKVPRGKVDGVMIGEPQRLAGASRLVAADVPVPEVERVVVDEEAARLHAQVTGAVVFDLEAFAGSAERARELAAARARELAAGFGE
jgi:hypothetical protein